MLFFYVKQAQKTNPVKFKGPKLARKNIAEKICSTVGIYHNPKYLQ